MQVLIEKSDRFKNFHIYIGNLIVNNLKKSFAILSCFQNQTMERIFIIIVKVNVTKWIDYSIIMNRIKNKEQKWKNIN